MYDREAGWWARRRDEPEHRPLIESTIAPLTAVVEPPGPLADIGCGPGAHARALAAHGYEVTGLDLAPKMVEAGREGAAKDGATTLTFQVADVSARLPFADGSLGGVLSVLLIQHLADPSAFVREVARCLRPGGHALLRGPARGQPFPTDATLYFRVRARILSTPRVTGFLDDGQLAALVEAAGLTIVDTPSAVPGGVSVLARR
jgi:SAM-dependent methyltransferase